MFNIRAGLGIESDTFGGNECVMYLYKNGALSGDAASDFTPYDVDKPDFASLVIQEMLSTNDTIEVRWSRGSTAGGPKDFICRTGYLAINRI
jgi:hypothetical protein